MRKDLQKIAQNTLKKVNSHYKPEQQELFFYDFLLDICKADKTRPSSLKIEILGDTIQVNNSFYFLDEIKVPEPKPQRKNSIDYELLTLKKQEKYID